MSKHLPRRQFLRAGVGVATTALVGCDGNARRSSASSDPSAQSELALAAVDRRSDRLGESRPDVEIALRAAPAEVPVLDGSATRVWRFTARRLGGPLGAIDAGDVGYLGPTLRLARGQRVRIRLENDTSEETIVHWHGLNVDERNDGHPSHAVPAGGRYQYDFEVANRAGTYWYHPHPDQRTGPQVYRGLAGLLLVSDDDELKLGLPDGDREHLLVLQDRTFDDDNQLVYAPNPMIGFLGERVLVNGQPARTKSLRRGPHRLRILNGSNSRIYDLAWSDGSPLVVIGTDGGLLDVPRERGHVVLAPAQRLDVWADFGSRLADDVWLESRAFDDPSPRMGMMGRGMMGRGMMGGGGNAPSVAHGAPLRIQRFVTTGDARPSRPPDRLVPAAPPPPPPAAAAGPAKRFMLGMGMMRWLINGRTFEMRGVADDERVQPGAVEDWEFVNPGGPMAMPHPIHLHGPQFRVVERSRGETKAALHDGLLDEGWQDTFLSLPGDRVRIRMRFGRHPGLFLYHCHNLEHEDMGMMRNYLVGAA